MIFRLLGPVALFLLALASICAADPTPEPSPLQFKPGEGFEVAKSDLGSLNISAYVLLRYLNQLPADQTFVDHLGRERRIDPRNDIELHRILIHFKGFLFSPKFTHQTSVWAINSTTNITAISALTYQFNKALYIGGGIGAVPGTRSMNYEHPFFLGTDRQMGDEFFRSSFSSGIWAGGEPLTGLNYRVMLADALNMVDITAAQLTRDYTYGGTLYWMPTTGEFGPKGGFGDFEMHERLATRFGVSAVHSREDRFAEINNPNPDNTQIRLSDSLLLFQTGSLAPDVTVSKVNYDSLALDASFKYRGFFAMSEFYFRKLSNFLADGAVPFGAIFDRGYMVQASYMAIPQKLEVYGSHSFVFGQFNKPWELGVGLNYFPYGLRNFKINGTVIYVDRSPTSSLFGYFVGGQRGPILSISTDFFF